MRRSDREPPAFDVAWPWPIRVRCGADWHLVDMRDGAVAVPHAAAELERERAVWALGGPRLTGCAAAHEGWRRNGIPLPWRMRSHRGYVLGLVRAGAAEELTALLDLGLDPHLVDGTDRTLLHLVVGLAPLSSQLGVVRRLVAAGLDVNAQDQVGSTPLHALVRGGGTPACVEALLAAGADPHHPDDQGRTPTQLAVVGRRLDLRSLLPVS